MISVVILAAGRSARMGKPKMLQRVEGRPMLEKVLEVFRHARVDEVVVVLGADAERIKKGIRFGGERIVLNTEYPSGMSSSLRLGLAAAGPRADAVIIALGDQPFLSPLTVDRLVERYLGEKAPVVVPVHDGVRGNPVLFARSAFPDIMQVRGDVGAKSVVGAYGDRVLEVPVEDGGVLFDIDTPADYERATSRPQRPRRRRPRGGAGQ